MQLQPDVLYGRYSTLEKFIELAADIPGLFLDIQFLAIAVGIRHIADDPLHLIKAAVDACDPLLHHRVGIILRQGEKTVRYGHKAGQGLPQFPGGKGHGLQLCLVVVLLQDKNIVTVYLGYGSTAGSAA